MSNGLGDVFIVVVRWNQCCLIQSNTFVYVCVLVYFVLLWMKQKSCATLIIWVWMRHFFERILQSDYKWKIDREKFIPLRMQFFSIANTHLPSMLNVFMFHIKRWRKTDWTRSKHAPHSRSALNRRELVFIPRDIIGKQYIWFIPLFCITTFWEAVISFTRSGANEWL